MTKIPSFVNLCHFFTFCHPKNQLEKYTPPYGTTRGDPILMEGTVSSQEAKIQRVLYHD
jgi:hypothetical protein